MGNPGGRWRAGAAAALSLTLAAAGLQAQKGESTLYSAQAVECAPLVPGDHTAAWDPQPLQETSSQGDGSVVVWERASYHTILLRAIKPGEAPDSRTVARGSTAPTVTSWAFSVTEPRDYCVVAYASYKRAGAKPPPPVNGSPVAPSRFFVRPPKDN